MKATKKQIIKHFRYVICVPYCAVQFLFPEWKRDYHTSGIYGWNADCFIVDNETIVVTGYRPFGNISAGLSLCEKYDKLAEKNIDARPKLRKEFAKRVLQECGIVID